MIDRDRGSFSIGPKTKLTIITILGAVLILSLGYILNRSVHTFSNTFSISF
ncbi:MAG: hypothetical protein ABEK17_02540 [Candidatus Aenigmatarchaeota archaeon]